MVTVTVTPPPEVTWYHEDEIITEGPKYKMSREEPGLFHLDITSLEISEQVRLFFFFYSVAHTIQNFPVLLLYLLLN